MIQTAVLALFSSVSSMVFPQYRAFAKFLCCGAILRPGTLALAFLISATAFSNVGFAQKQGREDLASQSAGGNDELIRLRARVEQLEEQLVDMQVTIGTVESLARKGGGGGGIGRGASAPSWNSGRSSQPSAGAAGEGRIQVLETQIGALTQQVEQLSRRLGGGSGAGATAQNQGFGDMTVTPGSELMPQSFDNVQSGLRPGGGTAQKMNFDNRPARAVYDEAYKYLLVQDYGAAESAFRSFLQNHSNNNLAGNAQYWLGESYYVRGQYKDAAGAFLKGYKVYNKNPKAPDSLLKLAMSLKRLGQKEAACQTFGELGSRFPRAPAHIKERAQSERRRSGC